MGYAAQDVPPPGGFGFINVARTMPRPILRGSIWAAIGFVAVVNGFYLCYDFRKRLRVLKLEQTEHYLATYPFIMAEQDRKFLLQLRQARDDERELMKNHSGWVVGTLYGEPVFKTLPKDVIPPLSWRDFAGHRPSGEWIWNVVNADWFQ